LLVCLILLLILALARGLEVVQYTDQQDFSLVAFQRQARSIWLPGLKWPDGLFDVQVTLLPKRSRLLATWCHQQGKSYWHATATFLGL
jgi:hypothetical protein